MSQLLDRIQRADEVGLDVFGIGEQHRAEHLNSAPAVILAAAAALTTRIRQHRCERVQHAVAWLPAKYVDLMPLHYFKN